MHDLIERLNNNLEKMSLQMEKAGFFDYVSLLQKPWKLIWINFIGGLFRGLGMAVGMGLVAAILLTVIVFLLKQMVNMPLLGQTFGEIMKLANQYLELSKGQLSIHK
jgi:hypothetical protein